MPELTSENLHEQGPKFPDWLSCARVWEEGGAGTRRLCHCEQRPSEHVSRALPRA